MIYPVLLLVGNKLLEREICRMFEVYLQCQNGGPDSLIAADVTNQKASFQHITS